MDSASIPNLEFRISNHFVGTRCFSTSNQFTTMLILCGPPPVESEDTSLIIRKRLPSGLISQGLGSTLAPGTSFAVTYVLRNRISGVPWLNVGSVLYGTAMTASPLRKNNSRPTGDQADCLHLQWRPATCLRSHPGRDARRPSTSSARLGQRRRQLRDALRLCWYGDSSILHLPTNKCFPRQFLPSGLNRISFPEMDSRERLLWLWARRISLPQCSRSTQRGWQSSIAD